MSDGITDAINACKAEDRWNDVIHPYVKNHLLGRKPEELTPKENYWMYVHYRKQEGKLIDEIRTKYNIITSEWWNAYIGQAEFKHSKYRGKISVKRKKK